MELSSLKKLKSDTISNKDLIFVQDMNDVETKALLVEDLSKYIITSSNLYNSLKTGSYLGRFVGNHYGISTNSTSSLLSSFSNTSNFLTYPNNSTSSFSIVSLSSSYASSSNIAISSSYSNKSNSSLSSSYVNILTYSASFKSNTSSLSKVSTYSNSSDYLIYDGRYNGIVNKSIISDYSYTSSFCYTLPKNKLIQKTTSEYKIDPAINGILVNDSTSSAAISSSIARQSERAEYIEKSDLSLKSKITDNSDNSVFAYINFKIFLNTSLTGEEFNNIQNKDQDPLKKIFFDFDVYQYKNIAQPGLGYWYDNGYMVVFTGSYQNPPLNNKSTVVLSDIGLAVWPLQTPVSFFYRNYGWPLDGNKFAVGIFYGSSADGNPKGNFRGASAESIVSVVMYSNSSGIDNPVSCSVETLENSDLASACSKV